jgi:hypothetical protein
MRMSPVPRTVRAWHVTSVRSMNSLAVRLTVNFYPHTAKREALLR